MKTFLLSEHHLKTPTLYGLSKIHKPGKISGIGSNPHKLAGILAKILIPLLGLISSLHLKKCRRY